MVEEKTEAEIEERRLDLQRIFGIPIALRRVGSFEIHRCPYCGESHSHGKAPGHRVAHCDRPFPDLDIVIGDRTFNPAYGYTIYHYDEKDGQCALIDHKA